MQIQIKTLLLLLLVSFYGSAQNTYHIKGKVFNQETPLINANVSINEGEIGTISDSLGAFHLTVNSSKVHLKVSYIGFKSFEQTLILNKDTTLTIVLLQDEFNEVTITDNRNTYNIGKAIISPERLKSSPTLLGEGDVVKIFTLQSGISTGQEGTSSILVRGGSADQNLILLDGIRMYSIEHLLGLVSLFNPNIIENAQVIKNGFSSEYGGRLSSVVKIDSKSGDDVKLKYNIGTLTSGVSLAGKKTNKFSYMAAARLGNLAIYTLPFRFLNQDANFSQTLSYGIYDFNFKAKYELASNSFLSFNVYKGNDNFNVLTRNRGFGSNDDVGISWGNQLAAVSYYHQKENKLTKIQIGYTDYHSNATVIQSDYNTEEETNAILNNSLVRDFSIKGFQNMNSNNWTTTYGAEMIYHYFEPSFINQRVMGERIDLPFSNAQERLFESALFIDGNRQLSDKIELEGGIRFGINYNDDFFFSLEPRLNLSYSLNTHHTLKASYAKMTQPVHLLSSRGVSLPSEIWVPANIDIPLQQSNQIDITYQYRTKKIISEVSVFYKQMEGLVAYKDGETITFNPLTRWDLLIEQNGNGQVYGAEFSLKKEIGNLKYWLAYTIMKNMRQFENLNQGNWYPYRFDRRHDLSITLSYDINKSWTINSNFIFSTGIAVTLPEALIMDLDGNYQLIYTEKNGARLPNYHRLDIDIQYKKTKKSGNLVTWSFGIYNTYGNPNVFSLSTAISNFNDGQNYGFLYHLQGASLFNFIPYVNFSKSIY